MDISRRKLLINGAIALTVTSSVLAVPSILRSSKAHAINKYNQWKYFPDQLAHDLDKYDLNLILPSLFSILLFANLIDFTQIMSLIIALLWISLPFIIF